MKNIATVLLALLFTSISIPTLADNIVVFGATGKFGSKMVAEALDRGHRVFGVSRSPENFSYTNENFIAVKGNPTELESVKQIVKDADAVLVALGDRVATTPEETSMNLTAINLSKALDHLGPNGPLVVAFGGGNTSTKNKEEALELLAPRLKSPNGDRLLMIVLSQWATYDTYRASNINWVFLAPPRNILGVTTGEDIRKGQYRITADGSLDKEANTTISNSDIAVAAIDLIENRKFSQQRVTIAY
jgi:putative NADH-flavin reductase